VKTATLGYGVPIVLVLSVGCGGKTLGEPCDPTGAASVNETELTETQERLSSACGVATAPIEPPKRATCGCPFGEGNTVRLGLSGEAYILNLVAACRRQVRSRNDIPYECLDTGVPYGPDVVFASMPATACYERGGTDQVREIVFSSNTQMRSYTERAGWRECSIEMYDKVRSLPDCP